MTKFRCSVGHEFAAPRFVTIADAPGMDYVCPVCVPVNRDFRVVELGGPVTEPDACEGACTL